MLMLVDSKFAAELKNTPAPLLGWVTGVSQKAFVQSAQLVYDTAGTATNLVIARRRRRP